MVPHLPAPERWSAGPDPPQSPQISPSPVSTGPESAVDSGTFARELPLTKYGGGNPFKKKNGGAWEVVGRLSRVDLTDGLVEGGELTDISAALNWYVNATTRVELNYIYASPTNQGAANIFLLRLQYQPW